MIKEIFQFTQQILSLARDMGESKKQIDELQAEVRNLTFAVQSLTFRLDQVQRDAQKDRELLMLQIENALLRQGRQLPPSSTPDANDEPKQIS